MKGKYILLLYIFSLGCNNYKMERKVLKQGGIEVNWYSEERGDNFIDFVMLNNGSSTTKLMECDYSIVTDIYLKKDTIFIKMYQVNDIAFFKDKAMNFYVRMDSSANYRDWLKVYQPDVYQQNSLSDADIRETDSFSRNRRMVLNIKEHQH